MHTVTFLLAPGQTWTLNFDQYVDAKRAMELSDNSPDEWLTFNDDYGIECRIKADQIVAKQVADIERVLDGQAANSLLQARANAKLQATANTDPALRFLAGQPNGAGNLVRPRG